jgi:hypothetical protein
VTGTPSGADYSTYARALIAFPLVLFATQANPAAIRRIAGASVTLM